MYALETLKREGKIRAIGASNLSSNDLDAYISTGQLDAVQEQYSMVHRDIESGFLRKCMDHNVSMLSYSSLALGLLSGKIGPDRQFTGDDLRINDPRFSVENREKVAAFARDVDPVAIALNATLAEVVVAWTLQHPGITFALCGARNAEQATENARAGALRLTTSDLESVNDAAARHLRTIHISS
jgi:aryl-alcohol dehydrogenase-like predicted oxidoreductase